MSQSEKLGELAKALAKAQSEMTAALKSSENPHFRSRYADLSAVFDACKEALNKNGFAIVQRVENDPNGACVETMLLHSSGEYVSSRCWLPVAQKTAQAYGSAITYARRYGLTSLAGVAADEDDDGNAASAPAQYVQRPAASIAPRQAPAQPVQTEIQSVTGPVIPFGKRKGQPVSSLDDKSLAWYRAQAEAELADPAKAKFHASTAQWLNQLAEEAQRRQN
jgi:hypothetical protein